VSISVNPTDPSCGIEGVAGKADVGATLNETVTDSSCKSLVGRCGDDECGGTRTFSEASNGGAGRTGGISQGNNRVG
jgi:hypothetical protein